MVDETRSLSAFASVLAYEDLPEVVVHEAHRALLDWLACAFAGAHAAGTDALVRVAGRVGPGSTTLVGRGERASAPFAALVNGFASHVEDYDDTFNPGGTTVHGSAPVWPVVFAAAQQTPFSGARALAAFVAGFETETRVGLAAGPEHYEAGWHVTGTTGHLGAAAAAANLFRLAPDVAAQAFGTAGTQAAGLKNVYGTDGKALHPGKAAMDGLLAGLAAAEGFSSSSDVLEGERGFLAVLAPAPKPDLLTEGLGRTWHLLANGYKAYPSGSLTHPTLDAIRTLRARHGFTAGEVSEVEAQVHPYAATVTGKVRPRTGLDAKFSLTHGAAVALVADRPGIEHFTDAGATDPVLAEMRERVTVVAEPTLTKRGAVVTITTTDGRRFTESVTDNRGTPDNPLPDDDLAEKFLDSAGPVLGASPARELLADCWRAGELGDFAALVERTGAVS